MRNLLFILAVGCLWICQSCSIATTVHFNKDFSGRYETVVDMTEFMGMAAMFDTTGSADMGDMIAQMQHGLDSIGLTDTYNGMSGIRNAVASVDDEGIMTIGFDFDNVESLNESFKILKEKAEMESEGMEDSGGMEMLPTDLLGGGDQTFTRSGKTISHTFDAGEGGLMGGEGEEGMDMFASMIDYTVNLTFDRKVKSVYVEGLELLEQGKNDVRTKVDFGKMMKDGKYSIKVNTK